MNLGRLVIGGVLHVLSARVSGRISESVGNTAVGMAAGLTFPFAS